MPASEPKAPSQRTSKGAAERPWSRMGRVAASGTADLLARVGVHVQRTPPRVSRSSPLRDRTKAVRSALGPDHLDVVHLDHREPDGDLFELFQRSQDVHKWHHYFDVYGEQLTPFRDRPIRLLEIGVYRGGSLRMWKSWFHPESTIVGIDIDPDCRTAEDAERGIFVRIGDQADPHFLRSVTDEFGPFDVILDDGGHKTSQTISSFVHLFRHSLADDALYLVEDTHTNWWRTYVDSPMTFVDFAKGLVELLHEPYFGSSAQYRRHVGESGVDLPWIEAWLHRISFYDSIVVCAKRRRIPPVPVRR